MLGICWGTRPEAIKVGPIVAALRDLDVPLHSICSGQHTHLLRGTPAETDLVDAQSLGLPSDGSITPWMTRAIPLLRKAYAESDITAVVIQGDTMTACAAARAAKESGLTLAHIEAGVRSHDPYEPFPEEMLRREITRLADYHYPATLDAMGNLENEGVSSDRVFLTGNPVVSALARYTEAKPTSVASQRIMVTLHRRETVQGAGFAGLVETLIRSIKDIGVQVVWCPHPSTRLLINGMWRSLPTNLVICDPLPYGRFAQMLAGSLGVLTDSGGVQEEAATLGVPCAVFRNVTDRPEAIDAGVAKLFSPTSENAAAALSCLVNQDLPRRPLPIYGQVGSASRIAHLLSQLVDQKAVAA